MARIRISRRGSSAGKSDGLITRRSAVQVRPPAPLTSYKLLIFIYLYSTHEVRYY